MAVDPLPATGWRLCVDTGGTFTDCLARAPGGELRRAKVLSTSALRARVVEASRRRLVLASHWGAPAGFLTGATLRLLGPEVPARELAIDGFEPTGDGSHLTVDGTVSGQARGALAEVRFAEEAPVLAARLVTGTPAGAALPPLTLRLATTRGTNALLERRGAPVALFVTRGFRDLLTIGTQQRPALFELAISKPAPFHTAVVEVPERLAADGTVLEPLRLEALAEPVRRLREAGIECAAVALLHSYLEPAHEEQLVSYLEAAGFPHVVGSAALAPVIQILPRAETAVVEAYLAPVMGDYLDGVAAFVPQRALHIMTSAGGLVRAPQFRATDGLLSGPAGGVVGAARAGRSSGFDRVLSFDMGGTSTDVARYDGDFDYLFEHRVGEARLLAPALALHTVAAGGGSVCAFDGERLRVGPESAGARPGPACYGAGGPLTLTDVNLLLGRLDPERFDIPLEPAAADAAVEALRRELTAGTAAPPGREALLAGLLSIADERMADAIRSVSVRQGYDPRHYALIAFGGAGAQHACAVARLLGCGVVVIPEDAGLLSARGLEAAVFERFAQRQVLAPLEAVEDRLEELLEELAGEARQAVAQEGIDPGAIDIRRRILKLRFAGQDSTLSVEPAPEEPVAEAFATAYREHFGYLPEGRSVEIESARVVASSRPAAEPSRRGTQEPFRARSTGRRRVIFEGEPRSVPCFERDALAPGATLDGPALVFERHSATVVAPGWDLAVDAAGALILRRR